METRLSSQLSKREKEIIALKSSLQASYQDHAAKTQDLNAKVTCAQMSEWHCASCFLILLPVTLLLDSKNCRVPFLFLLSHAPFWHISLT